MQGRERKGETNVRFRVRWSESAKSSLPGPVSEPDSSMAVPLPHMLKSTIVGSGRKRYRYRDILRYSVRFVSMTPSYTFHQVRIAAQLELLIHRGTLGEV